MLFAMAERRYIWRQLLITSQESLCTIGLKVENMSRIINAAASDDDLDNTTLNNGELKSVQISDFTDFRMPVNATESTRSDARKHKSNTTATNTAQASTYPDPNKVPTFEEKESASDRWRSSAPKLGQWLYEIAYPGKTGQGTHFQALAKKIQQGRGPVMIPDDIETTFQKAIEDRRCILRHRKHWNSRTVVEGTVLEESVEKGQEILDG